MNKQPFTIEQFYKHIQQGKLRGGKCKNCGKVHLPPRKLCDECLSEEFTWVDISKKGRLLTYTIIHVAPPRFQELAPYAVGIVMLESGLKIPGIIRDIEHEKIKIGMKLAMQFEASTESSQWPKWPRYYFTPT